MYVRKAAGGDFKSSDWRDDVSLYFCPLAVDTLPCPCGYVGSHVRPYEFGGDRLDRSLYAGVTEIVYRVEYSLSPRLRDKRTCRTVAHVDDDVLVADVDSFEIEAAACLARNSLKVGIEWLFLRHLLQVNAVVVDGAYHFE